MIQEGTHLSYSNSIKSLLNVQDSNIILEENFVKEGTFKGNACKYVLGKLTYIPTHCEGGGFENSDYMVYKNGTQLSRITLPITGVNPTYNFKLYENELKNIEKTLSFHRKQLYLPL